MRILLIDTNAYSAFQQRETTVQQLIEDAGQIYVPWILLGELYFGSFDGDKTQENINALQEFMAVEKVTVLFPDGQTAIIYGEIAAGLKRIGKPLQQNDIWIAALAKQHDYPLMTKDKAFKHIIGLRIVNW
jgi:tRNA(fMet)-specific endonuclease VapC